MSRGDRRQVPTWQVDAKTTTRTTKTASSAWPKAPICRPLHRIMKGIHSACVEHGMHKGNTLSYLDGANVAGFVRVADAMLAQGVV